jgi:hypothetical protein
MKPIADRRVPRDMESGAEAAGVGKVSGNIVTSSHPEKSSRIVQSDTSMARVTQVFVWAVVLMVASLVYWAYLKAFPGLVYGPKNHEV